MNTPNPENLAFAADVLNKPIRNFIQLDGFANQHGDCYSDDDGDGIFGGGITREPQTSGTTVRILIAADADQDDVVRIIRKHLNWIERRGLNSFNLNTSDGGAA